LFNFYIDNELTHEADAGCRFFMSS